MDVRSAARNYVLQMLNNSTGVKALLLDEETASMVSVVVSQTELLKHDVFLTRLLDKQGDATHPELQAIVYVRPTAENMRSLRKELAKAPFGSYKIYLSNLVRPTYIEEIADADETHAVQTIHEYYADYHALDEHLFSFNVSPCLDAVIGTGAPGANPQFERTLDGLASVLLALKRKPVVRYLNSSSLCRNLAERIAVRMDQESALFSFSTSDSSPLLLIIDRCEDPVTPLLSQWTYEAMVHELIGSHANRVSLKNAPAVPNDLREIVLDANSDPFFLKNRYSNFGDLGMNLKTLVDGFHKESKSQSELTSIEDMMRFVGNYPEFRRNMSNVSKHVALSGELSRLVEKNALLELSQLEQDIACREAEADHRKRIGEMLKHNKVSPSDKLRLVLLYSLRYEQTPGIKKVLAEFMDGLHKAGVGSDGVHLIADLRAYAGSSRRSADVFSNRSFFAIASNTVRRGIGGVDNVYTQHEPLLAYTIDDLLRGRLKRNDYPTVLSQEPASDSILGGSQSAPQNGPSETFIPPPREVIVFVAGGVTFEESKCVSAINGGEFAFVPPDGSTTASAATVAKQLGARIALGGSSITNSTSFAVQVARSASVLSAVDASRTDRIY